MYEVPVCVNLYSSHSVQFYGDLRQILLSFTQDYSYFVTLNIALTLMTAVRLLLYDLHTEFLYYDAVKMPVEPTVLR